MDKREEIRKEIIRDFVRFLKKEGVYLKYKENMANNCEKTFFYLPRKEFYTATSIDTLMEEGKRLIISAFCWVDTKEGMEFWDKLHLEWVDFFSQKYDNNEEYISIR